jgi:Ca2+-binding EF-hand superfamily protein
MKMKSIAAAAFVLGLMASPALGASALKALDTDKDGTLDLAEVKTAADKDFDKLDTDKDGTLDRKELKGRVSKKDWASADPDSDGTLSKEEYEAQVERAFNRADADHDGTLDAKELQTPDGQAALRLAR